MKGFVSFPEPVMEDKVRGKPEKFADHFTQAALFFNSQTQPEKNHIIGAFRFELTKVGVQAIRERVISMLVNVSDELAQGVADGIGIAVPAAMPRVLETPAVPEVTVSPALSLMARPGDGNIRGRKVALLVADGIDATSLRAAHAALAEQGALPRFIGPRLGRVQPGVGDAIHVEATFETAPSVIWDAMVLPAGDDKLALHGRAVEFLKDQYRHCKPILALGGGVVDAARLPASLPDGSVDAGLVMAGDDAPMLPSPISSPHSASTASTNARPIRRRSDHLRHAPLLTNQGNLMSDISTLSDLYVDELKDLWSANDQMARVLKKIAPKATNPKLKQMLQESQEGIAGHTDLLKALIANQDEKVSKEHCKGMEGLVNEAVKHTIDDAPDKGPLLDAAIIAQYQRMTHYGITGFGTVASFSKALKLSDDNKQLKAAVKDMHNADALMSELAEAAVNADAADE